MPIAVDDGAAIAPQDSPIRTRRRQRRYIALAIVLLLAAGLLTWGGLWIAPHTCRWLDFNLTKQDGQCIGRSNGDYAFSAGTAAITQQIATENTWVRTQWQTSDTASRKPYASVAVLMPMTSDSTSPLSDEQIRVSLEGAYSAQYRANHSRDIRDPSPLIQLLLVNDGSHETQWSTAVHTLLSTTEPDHPLLAVVGLGVSIPATQLAATQLSTNGLPMVGAVVTATNLSAQRLFEAGPSTLDYAKALLQYTTTKKTLNHPRVLVYDDSHDNFTSTLRTAFEQEFTGHINDSETFRGQANPAGATPDVFTPTVQNICLAAADQVLFAGRFRDLAEFTKSLATRSCHSQRPITVLTAATGLSTLFTADFQNTLHQGDITINYASATNATAWSAGTGGQADGYPRFHHVFIDQLRFPESDLADGYSIMHHDAMMTAIWAIRLAPTGNTGIPSREDVFQMLKALHGSNAIPAASGTLSYHDGSGWPTGKLVPIQQYPPITNPAAQPTPYTTSTANTP
jgi:hypothetical protein